MAQIGGAAARIRSVEWYNTDITAKIERFCTLPRAVPAELLGSLWKRAQSKDLDFLIRNYVQIFFWKLFFHEKHISEK